METTISGLGFSDNTFKEVQGGGSKHGRFLGTLNIMGSILL